MEFEVGIKKYPAAIGQGIVNEKTTFFSNYIGVKLNELT